MKKVAVLLSLGAFLMVSCTKSDQESQVSKVSSTPCQQTKAATNELQDKVDVAFTSEGVKITYNNFEVTCDFDKVDVTHSFVNGVLRITQQGTPNEAKCICYTDVSYTIKGITKNEVNVVFINGKQVYCHNGTNPQPNIKDGTYTGIFTVTNASAKRSGKTTVVLKNGRFTCSGNPDRIPAGGSGDFTTKNDTIIFNDENFWFADFDWNLILKGKYLYKYDGKKLYFSKKNDYALYEYDLELVGGVEKNEGFVTFGANYHVMNCQSTVTVFLDGEKIGVLQSPVDIINDCGEEWNLNRKIAVGAHSYRVEIRGGCIKDVAGTFVVSENECIKIFIDYHQIFNPQPNIKEGFYSGTFSSSPSSNSGVIYGRKVTLELKNGRFVCTDFSEELPSANGAGTYSIKNDTVIFIDEWIRFGMPLYNAILIGKFNYEFDGKRLILSNGLYIFDLELVGPGGCDKNVIVSATEFENAPNDHVSIIDMKIEGNCLKIKFSASGCDGNSWIVKLVAMGNRDKLNPIQTTLRLSLDNKELCDAVITKEMSFNIEDLQIIGDNRLILNISGKSILYEY